MTIKTYTLVKPLPLAFGYRVGDVIKERGGQVFSKRDDSQHISSITDLLEEGWIEVTEIPKGNTLIKINGGSFRCICGSNVFTPYSNTQFRCNGCDISYTATT